MSNTDSNFPELGINVSHNKLKAYITIIPTGDADNTDISIEQINKYLKDEGINFGIQELVVKDVVSIWNSQKQTIYEELIAEGIPPHGGQPENVSLEVRGVKDPAMYDKIYQFEIKHFCLIKDLGRFDDVKEGIVLARIKSGEGFVIGKSVHGEKIPPEYDLANIPQAGEGVAFDEESMTYISETAGIAALIGNVISVIPIVFQGHAECSLDQDAMKATISLYPAFKSLPSITPQQIVDMMVNEGIKSGIDTDSVEEAVAKCQKSGQMFEFIGAEGTPPLAGDDGKIEYIFDFMQSLEPEKNSDGSVDFKNVSIIKSVAKDDELARYIPPTRGTPGNNLMGVPIPARDGKDIKMPQGINTRISEDDPNSLMAAVDGNARINGILIEVAECYVVPSDVDYKTGNINYPNTVIIRGDIKSGFNANVGQDLEVNGIVEDCKVKVGGDVLIRAGFMGNGGGNLEAKGEVGLGYVRNQIVKSRKNISISGEAINSHLYARKSIDVGGKKLGISGGTATARREIICETAGSEAFSKTQLEVGVDFALVEEKFRTDERIKELTQSRLKIMNHLEKMVRIKKIKKTLPKKEMILIKKMGEMKGRIDQQLESLEDRQNLINEKLSQIGKARVLVRKTIYPGVIIKIGPNYFNATEELRGPKSFIIRNGVMRQE